MSHGAFWSYHRLGLRVFAWLCLESFGIGFLDTKRHLRPFAWAKQNKHKRTKRVKTWKRRRRPTTALRRPHACFFPAFPKAIWARLLNGTHETWINRKDFAARSESEVVTKSICITHAAIKTGSSNYHTEMFLVLIIFKSEEQMMINKQNPRLTLQQEWPEKITEKLTTTPGIISDTKRLGMQWCHISFEQKSTAGSRVKRSTENHRSRDLGSLDYLSSAT